MVDDDSIVEGVNEADGVCVAEQVVVAVTDWLTDGDVLSDIDTERLAD